jgi:hypothetical protein
MNARLHVPAPARRALPPVAVGLASLAAYAATMTPGVTFIDSGELAAVATTLGVAHPTGYPLFTLLGWAAAHFPLGSEPVVRLNFFAGCCSAAGAGVFVLVLRRLILSSGARDDGFASTLAAMTGAMLIAFSETYWSEALAVEVYPLHVLLVALVLLSFFRAAFPLPGEGSTGRQWYVFSFLVGLAFTNHMTTILLAPGLLYLYVSTQGWAAESWRRLFRMALPFGAGLSLYLYLPIRAMQGPLFCWGNPDTPGRFLEHAFGKQYRIWIFSSSEVAGRQLSHFIGSLPGEMNLAGLLLAAAGLVMLWRRRRTLWVGSVLLFAGCVGYSVNYDIKDIDSYFLLAYIVMGMWATIACYEIALRIPRTGRWGVVIASAGLVGVLVWSHGPEIDRSDDHLVEDYTNAMFASLDSGAVVFSYQWDYWVASSYYEQYVRGIRIDVTVIDKELLRRSWYLLELSRRVPWLIASTRREVDAFLRAVAPFEQDLPFTPSAIETRYQAMIAAMIRESAKTHPVYVTEEIEPQYTQGYWRVPAGLALRLDRSFGSRLTPMPVFRYRPFRTPGRLEDMTKSLYADAYLARGEYALVVEHDTTEASKSLKNAVSFISPSQRSSRLASMLESYQKNAEGLEQRK